MSRDQAHCHDISHPNPKIERSVLKKFTNVRHADPDMDLTFIFYLSLPLLSFVPAFRETAYRRETASD